VTHDKDPEHGERAALAEMIEKIEKVEQAQQAELDALLTEPAPPDQAELTALRAANRELVRINERLADAIEKRTAEMLDTRDAQAQFVSDVNRQVRGPLDAIIGYSELLTEDLTSLELHDLAHDVEKIRSAGEAMLEMLGALIERRRLDGR
jgi:signal transduction histidine kinase